MSDQPPAEAPASQPNAKGVLCIKCDHLNAPGSRECDYCQAALWVACRHCGAETQRALTKCTHCGHRIHRHWRRPLWWKRLFYGGRKLTLSQVMVILIIVLVTYLIIFELPKYWNR
ncbi:MAG TPA: zinc ribbon domain-containing protein [Candidatus Paceibacterota bacterium]|nr:zinc ribbon domain-containing protein [Verrucomicrobiota bacterium]HOX03301.1 zinc ribbon domain-containing protein [Verrucomicrobiota bacterium]HRZ46200.1 zinc ribbon domain-containing protein [Candidatus Paceibacterota bacterium]